MSSKTIPSRQKHRSGGSLNSTIRNAWEEHRRSLLADEIGTIRKDPAGKIRIALVFPSTYEVGMSNLGFQVIYRLFNEHPDYACERTFLPDPEHQEEIARRPGSLRTLENAAPIQEMDIVAFSISFELDYLNVLKILDLSGLPLLSADRDESDPLVIAGGPAMMINPEPLSPFLDAACIGDGEELAPDLMDAIHRTAFSTSAVVDRRHLLRVLSRIEGIYIPSFYRPETDESGRILRFEVLEDGAPFPIRRRITRDLGKYNVSSVIRTPRAEFSDTHLVEVSRGCARSCRFCFAGYGFRPVRYRKSEDVRELLAQGAMANACDASIDDPIGSPAGGDHAAANARTHQSAAVRRPSTDARGFGDALDTMAEQVEEGGGIKVGLIGSSLSDNPWTTEIAKGFADRGYQLNAASLRAETTGEELTRVLSGAGQRMLTLAPEAGTERLRKAIKKPMKDDAILQAVGNAVQAGIRRIKLYFMCGLPGETEDDVRAIVDLCRRILDRHPLEKLVVSLNPFVPKPFTPFQWHPQATAGELEEKKRRIENGVKDLRGAVVRMESTRLSEIQAILSRGDRRVADLLLAVHHAGGSWKTALRDGGFDVDHHLRRSRDRQEIHPWEILDLGLKRSYLWAEYQAGLAGQVNPRPFMTEAGTAILTENGGEDERENNE